MHSKKFYLDLLERAVWTFAQGGAAVVIAQQAFNSLALKAALIAGGLAVVKAFVAGQFGKPDSAALPETK